MNFLCFLAIFELMSDSLKTTQVEPNQCPLHQSILHIQGPIPEIFTHKKNEHWRSPENDFCLVICFLVFAYWVKKFFLVFFNERNQGGSYEVVFISALWMVSSESLKRGCPN